MDPAAAFPIPWIKAEEAREAKVWIRAERAKAEPGDVVGLHWGWSNTEGEGFIELPPRPHVCDLSHLRRVHLQVFEVLCRKRSYWGNVELLGDLITGQIPEAT